jgi:DNA polymerase-3 subunit gamma/tau
VATALYRRYRPESFAEVIGQDHVTTPLRRALRAGRVGHAYLFSGPRGCGKTTSARILARCLNCAEGPTDTPCGTCDSCRDLARGGAGSLDVVEIDAASHGGVDDARELRERASFAPVRDRFKVFIIDEAHMVTSAGFNALLKLVEEPPDHVKFVFATTEPDKVIGTIRSRTHHYPFRLIPPQVLGPYLEEVCTAEDVQVGEGVMPLVVRAGGGSARDSMSVLDQLMAGAGEDGLDFPTAIALLGFTDTALLDQAVTAVAERDAAALYGAVEHVLATGHEPRRFVEDLLERMRDLIVLAAVPDRAADLLPQVPADELERMRGQAALFAPADLSQCGDLVHETLSTMSGATSPRLHLELLAARLVLRDERAALAAADGPTPQGAGASSGAPSGRGTAERSAGAAPSGGGGGREEARRIAQERAEAARQARGGRQAPAPAASAGAQSGPSQSAPQDARPQEIGARQDAPGAHQDASGSRQDMPGSRQDAPGAREDAPAAPGGATATADAAQDAGPSGGQQPQQAPEEQREHRQAPVAPAPSGGPLAADGSDGAGAGAAAPQGGGLDAEAVRGHWSAILDELQQIRRPSWALVSQNAHVNGAHGSTLVLGFRTEGLVSAFHRGTAAENLADAVRRIMHAEITVDAVVGEDPGPGAGPGGSGPGGGGPGGGGPGGGGPRGGGPGGAGPGGPGADGADRSGPAPSRQGRPDTGRVDSGRPGPGRADAGRSDLGRPDSGRPASGRPGSGTAGSGGPSATPSGGDPAPQSEPRAAAAPWGDAAAAMTSRAGAPASAQPAEPVTDPARGTELDQPASAAAQDASDSSTTRPGAEHGAQTPSAGQRASERAMAAAARAARNSPAAPFHAPDEDFPPEPDDPYPPDPEEYGPPAPREQPAPRAHDVPREQNSAPAPQGARWSDALEDRAAGASGGPKAPGAPAAGAAPAPGSPASGGAPLEVEDEGRDSLPEGEPRTFGQNALRRALAEGRVVRSRPAAHLQQEPSAPAEDPVGGAMPHATGFAPEVASPSSPDTPPPAGLGRPSSQDTASDHVGAGDPGGQLGGNGGAGVGSADLDGAGPGRSDAGGDGADGSATARATASWGAAAAVTGSGAPRSAATAPAPPTTSAPGGPVSPSGSAPSSYATSASAPAASAAAPSAAAPPRSGAALVREAAMASRTAGQRGRGGRRDAEAVPEADVDPTGGATRDDEDAVVATRNGREVIEKMLGGRVLEVIDETGPR